MNAHWPRLLRSTRWSPANALDAASIAAATKAVVIILFMVNAVDRRNAQTVQFVFVNEPALDTDLSTLSLGS